MMVCYCSIAPDPALLIASKNKMGIQNPIEATIERLQHVLAKNPVLWVGAGVSIAAGYPSTNDLVQKMRNAVETEDGPIATNETFERVADAYVATYGNGALGDLLQQELGPPRPPTGFHRCVALLVRQQKLSTIVTTNYDDALERAFAAENVHVVVQAKDHNEVVLGGDARLIKLHGTSDDWMDVVLSGQSYSEFKQRYDFVLSQLNVLLRSHWVLFAGCSLQDPRILDWIHGMPVAAEKSIKPWRALMTMNAWDRAVRAEYAGSIAAQVFGRAQLRCFTLSDHRQLDKLFNMDLLTSGDRSSTGPCGSDAGKGSFSRSRHFHEYGTLPSKHPSYIARHSDVQMESLIREHVFIAVEGPNQIGKSSLLSQYEAWLGADWKVVFPPFELMPVKGASQAIWDKAFFRWMSKEVGLQINSWLDVEDVIGKHKLAFVLDEFAGSGAKIFHSLIVRLFRIGCNHRDDVRVIAAFPGNMKKYMSDIERDIDAKVRNVRYSQVWKTLLLQKFSDKEATELFRVFFSEPVPGLLATSERMSVVSEKTKMLPSRLQKLSRFIWSELSKTLDGGRGLEARLDKCLDDYAGAE